MKEKINISIEKIAESRIDSVDFENLKFGNEFSDHMFIADYFGGKWQNPRIMPLQELKFSPASSIFHYGQAVFEGLKAYKREDDSIAVFRPIENQIRLNKSAHRLCMQEVPEELFMEGLKQLIDIDRAWVPKGEDKSLYVRPFIIADQVFLGVRPADNYKFIIITSPVANYYSGAIKVKVETEFVRASKGGIGAAKAAGNYAASLYPAQKAKEAGYDQLIWTDSQEHKYIEESGTMNLMLRIGDRIITPSIDTGSILAGITRDSILKIAKDWGYQVEERRVSVKEIIDALKEGTLAEAFGAGTAATVTPISSIHFEGTDYSLSDHTNWEFVNRVRKELKVIKNGEKEDKFGWILEI